MRGQSEGQLVAFMAHKVLCVCLELVMSPFQVPFTVLQGEGVEYLGHANDAVIAISNYRLHIKFKDSVINVSSACSCCLNHHLSQYVGRAGRGGIALSVVCGIGNCAS